jgi:predicted dehydrogenase
MKALFIGLGSVGQRHLRNLLSIMPETEIMAVRSTRTAPLLSSSNQVLTSTSITEKYKIEEIETLTEALGKKPNLVFVTNPSSMHLEIAYKALESGAFIFIEKPLSDDWDGVEELLHLENKIGERRVAIGYMFRFHPVLNMLKKEIDKGRIGTLVGARLMNGEYMPGWHPYEDYRKGYPARKDLGGGAIVTLIHDFDYAMWLFGEPDKIFALGGHISNLDINVEDSAQVLMRCNNGKNDFPVSISMDYLQWPAIRTISITGDRGSIEGDLTNAKLTVYDRVNDDIEKHEFPNFNRNDLFLAEIKNFLAFANGNEQPVVDLKSGAKSLKVAIDAREFMETV